MLHAGVAGGGGHMGFDERVEQLKAKFERERRARKQEETQLRRNASRVADALRRHGVEPTELRRDAPGIPPMPGYERNGLRPGSAKLAHGRSRASISAWLIHEEMLAPPSPTGTRD